MSISDDFNGALKVLIENVAAYRDQLRAAGQGADADTVGEAHGDLLNLFGTLNAQALDDDLDQDTTAADQLKTITDKMGDETKNLNKQEATVKWVVNLADGFVKVFLAAATGGTGTAVSALWTAWNSKPN